MTDTEYDPQDPSSWPDDSYDGRERDLANLLNGDTMEWVHVMNEYGYSIDESGINPTSWHLFNLLMMHPTAARAMTDAEAIDDESLDKLIAQIQDDAHDGSGDAFQIALSYRYQVWTTLQDLTSQFRNQTYSIDDI